MDSKCFDLSGRVALVTGASSGFGEHFTRVLAAAGARVVAGARREDRLHRLVDDIAAAGGAALAVAMDVTDAASVAAAFAAAEAKFGTVDLLVNNAGVAAPGTLHKTAEADWDWVVDTNLKGAWLVAAEAARRMLAARRGGAIVNIASVLGMATSRGHGVYSATKAGVIQLTKHMALELAGKNIRVNAICPGYFKTEMNDEYFDSAAGQAYIAATPGGRLGRMEEMDGPLLLLASDAGSFINGALLPVDGGHLVMSI
ncbi:MAG: glucose 1-dehydrogenase [Gammaproteobacteria bacterium]|nr:glucose 1-dehydrogenase [Gammaproteobacteria bacterium]MBK9426090.1 glucose 1-dehydrogenase [Gammaproteobacteria bacterium]